MNFEPSADQRAFLDAVERIAARHGVPSLPGDAFFETSTALQDDLEAAGLSDAALVDELGPVAAAMMVTRLARLPGCVELVGSALVFPGLEPALPRPCALLWDRRDRPARFLPGAHAVLHVAGDRIEMAALRPEDVVALDSPFGYPTGRLLHPEALHWTPMAAVEACELQRLFRVGLAAELAGLFGAALDSVVEHVSHRRQFGRPLGAFQAIQHRLAEAAVRIEAMQWLAWQAAASASPAHAAAAGGYAQDAATTLIYDFHQFMGAMGLTLEHPLHRWTTRAKMLRADLGGAAAQYQALTHATWGPHQRKAAR